MSSGLDFFTQGNALYKKLIRKQGHIVCRDQIYQGIINDSLDQFTHGFISISQKAQIGRARRGSNDDFIVNGFSLLQDYQGIDLRLLLICNAVRQKGAGRSMMEQIIVFGLEAKFSRIQLYALPDPKLVRWYESFGFEVITPLYRDGEVKVYDMQLILERPDRSSFRGADVSRDED